MNKPASSERLRVPPRSAMIAIVVLVPLIVGIYWLTRPPALAPLAGDLAKAILRGDTHTLYQYGFPQDLKANNLSEARFAQYWRELVGPRFEGFRPRGPVQSELDGNGDEGSASLTIVDDAGHAYDINVSLWKTDEGPKLMLSNMILAAWVADGVVRRGKRGSLVNVFRARLDGLARDRAKLDALGIRYVYEIDLRHGMLNKISWDQYEAGTRRALKELEAAGKTDY